jgi:UDP-N-acetylmuramoylalanine--D-glutamate ligase
METAKNSLAFSEADKLLEARSEGKLHKALSNLKRRAIHVVGPSGTEGSAVIDFLLSRGITTITAHDLAPTPEQFADTFRRTHQWLDPTEREVALARLRASSVDLRYRDRYLQGIERADLIVVPQSSFRHPENAPLRALRERGVPFTSMTRLFFETCLCPIIGVTGTNGKFTVATLIYEMLREAGRTVFVSGNDRTHVPMLYYLDRITPDAWLVLEISNRQLVDLERSPHIGVITNLAPHHVDDHGTMEAYAEVKATLIRHQGPDDHAVLNRDNPYTREMGGQTRGRVSWFSAEEAVERGAHVDGDVLRLTPDGGGSGTAVIAIRDLPVPGRSMVENALAACAAAWAAGVTPDAMAAVLRRFRGLPYRFSHVGEIRGIAFYEDSLATNPTAAAAAIQSLDRPFLLIAGGLRRGATPDDFRPMVDAVAASGLCKAVLLIGSTAGVLSEALAAVPPARRPAVFMAETLEGAMAGARRLAVAGNAVLLSPGCESFDQFADYRERGDRFRALAEEFAPAGAKLEPTE